MILVTQIGARRHYAVPAALERAGLLSGLYTDVCMAAPWLRMLGKVLPKSAPIPGWKSLVAREVNGVPDSKITSLWSAPWMLNRFKRDEDYGGQYARFAAQNEAFGNEVVARGFGNAKAVYGFNGAAVEIFRAAKTQGMKCILDMTIAPLEYVERILAEEREKFSEYLPENESDDPSGTMVEREREEWELADLILCGSEFVHDSLANVGVDRLKCRTIRWGYSGATIPRELMSNRPKPFRCSFGSVPGPKKRVDVLVAGTVELRKGVQYILQAMEMLPSSGDIDFSIQFVGPMRLSEEKCVSNCNRSGIVIFHGPAPRSEMPKIYQSADILLHPSLAEGSANVCYEAMAHGLPVIATPNAGSAITDGVDGIIIPIRDPDAIVSALCKLRDDPALRLRMGEAARQRAASLTIDQYQNQLAEAVKSVL